MLLDHISLYYTEGSSDKVYHIQLEAEPTGFLVNFQYGRRGSALKADTKTKAPIAIADAKKIYDKLVKEKLSKGYTPGESGQAYQSTELAERVTGLVPQLLNPIDEAEAKALLDDPDWGLQEKMDGERRMVRVNAAVVGSNRKGLAVALPKGLAESLATLQGEWVLDAEHIGDELHVFDVLVADNRPMGQHPYHVRHALLAESLPELAGIHVVPLSTVTEDKHRTFAEVRDRNGEGVVFKHLASVYSPGRPASGGTQLKFKFQASATVQVLGQTLGKRSVAVGVQGEGGLVPVGNVTIPANHELPEIGALVEVQYLYAYKGGSLYQPVYKGLRADMSEPDYVSSLKLKAEASV